MTQRAQKKTGTAGKRRAPRKETANGSAASSNGDQADDHKDVPDPESIEADGQVTADPPPPEETIADGVFIVIERDENGSDIKNIRPIPQGDVRPAEVLTILEKGIQIVKAGLGIKG